MHPLPETVGVIGGGRMGAGIAYTFLTAGCDVVVRETDDGAAAVALARIDQSIAYGERLGALGEDAARLRNRLCVTTDMTALADRALVIEAVPENLELKVRTLAAAQDCIPRHAVLASNTSSLSIDTMAAALREPARFLGLHFFNPVPSSELVEVVHGRFTDAETARAAVDWVGRLGKRAVTVRDSPGFATSRLGVCLALEAIRMLEDGVASAEDIDEAMKLGYGHPVGPLRLTDIVGLDVRLAIAEHLARELGARFEPPELLRTLVAHGHTGRKSGRGFYSYS